MLFFDGHVRLHPAPAGLSFRQRLRLRLVVPFGYVLQVAALLGLALLPFTFHLRTFAPMRLCVRFFFSCGDAAL
jgi:hypothetical protein